jgi:molybdenum cofactor synthesis domain-containing protein
MDWRAQVITVSDGVHHGVREDASGDALEALLLRAGAGRVGRRVVPDDKERIVAALTEACRAAELVVTTGGTGFGPRDVTPEAAASIMERQAPGLVHLMLARGIESTPYAALTRAVAGTVGSSLVVTLPGSPRGATENLTALLDVIPHALQLLSGDTDHG